MISSTDSCTIEMCTWISGYYFETNISLLSSGELTVCISRVSRNGISILFCTITSATGAHPLNNFFHMLQLLCIKIYSTCDQLFHKLKNRMKKSVLCNIRIKFEYNNGPIFCQSVLFLVLN